MRRDTKGELVRDARKHQAALTGSFREVRLQRAALLAIHTAGTLGNTLRGGGGFVTAANFKYEIEVRNSHDSAGHDPQLSLITIVFCGRRQIVISDEWHTFQRVGPTFIGGGCAELGVACNRYSSSVEAPLRFCCP